MFLKSTLLKSFSLFYTLSKILFSNDALCSRLENELNLLSLNEKQKVEVTEILSEEERQILKYQSIIKPLIENEHFNKFKEIIKKAIKSSKKTYKELEKHEYQHNEFLSDLEKIISDISSSDLVSYEENKINGLLDDFNLLLNKKKYHKDNIDNWPNLIANLDTDFEEISKLLPIISKVSFYVEDEDGTNIFEDFYDDIDSLKYQMNEMKGYFDSYVVWLLESTEVYAFGEDYLNILGKQNDLLSNLSLCGYFGDKVRDRGINCNESITKFLNDYYKCVKEESKYLFWFVRILISFNMYCESCDDHFTYLQKIMDIN